MRLKYTSIILLLCSFSLQAQTPDSIPTRFGYKKAIIPTLLIGSGLLLNHSKAEQQFQVNIRNKVGNDFVNHIDDYLVYAPIVEMYGADLMGIKSKHHWFDQTKYFLLSNLLTGAVTHLTKILTKKTRPDGSSLSFPSGHTSFAFTNAAVLYQEFKESAPILAYSGYAIAGTTGTFRILNNKHWISDVLVGAGLGILITELVYYIEPLKNFNPFLKSKNISLMPQIGQNDYRFYFSYRF